MYFLALFRQGPAWLPGVPLEQQPYTAEHAQHLQRLYSEGKVFMGGPCDGGGNLLSVVVLRATSAAEARSLIADNAFVTQGVVTVDVLPWHAVFDPRPEN